MSHYQIIGRRILTPDFRLRPGAITIDGGRLVEVRFGEDAADVRDSNQPVIDAGECIVSPGLIDLHVNGGGGADFQTATPEAIETALAVHVRGGTTGLLAALNTVPPGEREPALRGLRTWLDEWHPHPGPLPGGEGGRRPHRGPLPEGEGGRHPHPGPLPEGEGDRAETRPTPLLGVYLEGPYYHAQERGAHREEFLRAPDPAEYLPWLDEYGGLVKVFSCAPELPGTLELIRACAERGVVAAAGHSTANDDEILAAIEAGLRLVTHIYSAHSVFHREPGGATKHLGLAEMSLLLDELTVEIIPDGKHLRPLFTRLILKSKTPDQVCVTTDAMLAVGLGPGLYEFLGTKVLVEDGVAWRPDRQRYAGSVLTMDAAVRHLVREVGVAVETALRMASLTPATVLGLQGRKGTIKARKDADLTILTPDLQCAATIVGGRVAFVEPDSGVVTAGLDH